MASGQVINGSWLTLYYPPYWHYDTLHALLILSRMGKAGDPRASDALDEMEQRRRPDGRWRVLVAATGKLRCTRSRRLGPVGPERDDHSQRPTGTAGRWPPWLAPCDFYTLAVTAGQPRSGRAP